MVNKYFLTVVLKPNLEEKDRKGILDVITKKIGKVEKEDVWGMRDLAYKIQGQTKGYYVHYEFELESSEVAALDKAVKLEEDVLRYLLVRR